MPHEAIIGIIYIVAAAASTLVLSRTAAGDEEIKTSWSATCCWSRAPRSCAPWSSTWRSARCHFALRRKFHLVSFEPEKAERQGLSVRLWDFLFYATFGLVVTSFVQDRRGLPGLFLPDRAGGLRRPALRQHPRRLLIGWRVALTAGVAGLVLVDPMAKAWTCPPGPPSSASSASCSSSAASSPGCSPAGAAKRAETGKKPSPESATAEQVAKRRSPESATPEQRAKASPESATPEQRVKKSSPESATPERRQKAIAGIGDA